MFPPHSSMIHGPKEQSLILPRQKRQIHSIHEVEFRLQYLFEGVKSMYLPSVLHIATKPVLLKYRMIT